MQFRKYLVLDKAQRSNPRLVEWLIQLLEQGLFRAVRHCLRLWLRIQPKEQKQKSSKQLVAKQESFVQSVSWIQNPRTRIDCDGLNRILLGWGEGDR